MCPAGCLRATPRDSWGAEEQRLFDIAQENLERIWREREEKFPPMASEAAGGGGKAGPEATALSRPAAVVPV
jgi:hypothetical protein